MSSAEAAPGPVWELWGRAEADDNEVEPSAADLRLSGMAPGKQLETKAVPEDELETAALPASPCCCSDLSTGADPDKDVCIATELAAVAAVPPSLSPVKPAGTERTG